METSDQLADTLRDLEIYGLDRPEVDQLFAKIDAVTLAAANGVARKYYQTGGLTFVLVGNAAKIRSAVSHYAPAIREISVTKPGFSVE